MSEFFAELKRYVGFSSEDQAALAEFLPLARPSFEGIVERFYRRIQENPGANAVLRGGEGQIQTLRRTLLQWLESGLAGPHDEAFHAGRRRIGQAHVDIALPQQYMFGSINLIRLDLRGVIERTYPADHDTRCRTSDAVDRWLDLELAVMLQAYGESMLERLRRRERLVTLGQMAAGICHDLRNPLGTIGSSLYLLREYCPTDERVDRHLERIRGQLRICSETVQNLLGLARDKDPERDAVHVPTLLEGALARVDLPEGVSLQSHVSDELELFADPALLRQALVNLLNNAAAAMTKRGGTIHVHAAETADGIVLEVLDEGPGFDPGLLPRALDPLVSSRSGGTGIGLALVRRIIEKHGGHVELGNRPEGGAQIRLCLPSAQGQETEPNSQFPT